MNTSFLKALACATLVAAACPAQADPKADVLLREAAAKTRATKTLTAEIEMVAHQGAQPLRGTGTVKLKRPNRAVLQVSGPFAQKIVSDGKTLWTEMPGGAQYRKVSADPRGGNIELLWAFPVQYFFAPSLNLLSPTSGKDAKTRYIGAEKIGGVSYQVVEATAAKPLPHTLRMYFGPDRLFRRVVVELKQGNQTAKFEATLKNVRAGTSLPESTFAYTPPKDARPYEAPDFNAKLVPVGQKAPEFDLPTPSGGTLALENTRKEKKAVLVNFWFYN